MRSRTWTPVALSPERRRLSGTCWRAVEAQHRVSTMKIVDTLAEQSLLETVLEQTKPPIPAECRHLHYLLATPFRYGAPYPAGSRFRRAGYTPGVFYASTTAATAVAELAFHRLLFYADSPGTPWPADPGECTTFSVTYRTPAGLDLTTAPSSRTSDGPTRPTTGRQACRKRAQGRRRSNTYVRADPGGVNIALLACRVRPAQAARSSDLADSRRPAWCPCRVVFQRAARL